MSSSKNVEERPSSHGHKERIHAVVKCDYCSTVWSRDVNAAGNMRYLIYGMHGNERPEASRRPRNTIPINAEDSIEEKASML
jgi:transposase